MGSGNRLKLYRTQGFALGVYVGKFPFAVTVELLLGPVTLSLGFGKGYDHG